MKKLSIPFILLFLVFFSNSLWAQNSLDSVVVTAQKRTELLQRSPIAITALNANQINAFRVWSIKEISGIAPNLFGSDPGDGRDVLSIRGITTTSYDPAVAVYIDGVNQFSLDTYIPNLFDIERVEVLRGPQGSLYGRNALGGVINIITKQPTNATEGSAQFTIGNYNQQRLNLNVRSSLIPNKLFIGTSVLQENRKGFYTNEFNGKDYDRMKAVSGNIFLKYLLNTKWNAVLNFKNRVAENKGAFPLVFGVDEAFNNPFKLNQNAGTTMKDRSMNTSLVFNYNNGKFQFSSQTAFQRNYRYYTDPIDGDFSPIDGISVINNYGKDFNNIKAWTQDIRFNAAPINKSPLKWIAGIYLFSQSAPNKQATRFGVDANLMGVGDSLFTLRNTTLASKKGWAIYGQVSYALNDRLTLTAGLRQDHEKLAQTVLGEYQHDPSPDFIITQPSISGETSFNAFSPKLGLDYVFNASQMAYLSYSRGFRTGGLSPFSSDPSQPPLVAFKPEFSNNFEIGWKNSFLNNTWRVNLAFFYTNLTDAQVPSLILPDAITITKNVGKLNSKGMELELIALPWEELQLQYSFGYTKATYESLDLSQNGSIVNLKGNKQLFSPDITSMLAVQYNHTFSKKWTGFVRTEWKYLGVTYFDLSNLIRQSPYHVLNASAGLGFRQFKIQLWGRNLMDTPYISYAYDFGAVHLGDPKTIGATLSVQF